MVERVRRARWRDCPALKEAPGPPTGGLCHGGGAATENRAYAGAYFRARLQPSGNGLGRIAPHSGGACPQTLPRRIRLHRRRADVETAQWIRAALLGCSAFVRAFAGFRLAGSARRGMSRASSGDGMRSKRLGGPNDRTDAWWARYLT